MNREELLAAWLERELDESGRAELLRALSMDEAFAREAAGHLQMRRLLGSLKLGEGDFTSELLLKVRATDEAPDECAVLVRLQHRRWWQRAGLLTAGLAAAAAITILMVLWPAAAPRVRVLAAEGVQSLDVRALESGRPVRIEGGILELALGTKTRLVFEGPADFSVESVNRVRLASGRCYAEMEKGASGLRIETPSGEVLDLGTRFGVEVLPAETTMVHVFEGAVEVGAEGRRTRLREGEGANWTTDGRVAGVPAEAERFVSRLPGRGKSKVSWVHWPFDENGADSATPRGAGFPEAMSPARIHGAQWTAREGSGALEFNGVSDWVETTFAGIAEGADRTVAAWVKLGPDFGATHGQAIVGWGDFSIEDPNRRKGAVWELGIGDMTKPVDVVGRLKVAVGGPLTVGHADLRDGRWHHVAAVYLGNGAPDGLGIVLLYVDGELQRRTFGRVRVRVNTDVRPGHAEPVQFGRQVMRVSPAREFFKGAIDEVFIIGAALTGDEIRHVMKQNALP